MKNAHFFLKMYAVTLTFVLAYLIFSGFSRNPIETADEITVQRINIVEPDGKLKMVISNSEKQHPGMFDGKMLPDRVRPAGMIFFNEEEDEVGGLVYQGSEDGNVLVLSVDQYKSDQVMQLQYLRSEAGKQQYGLNLWDRSQKFPLMHLIATRDSLHKAGVTDPEDIQAKITAMNGGKPVSPVRMFAGKTYDEDVGLFIKDDFGNNRVQLYIDKNNQPKLVFLNESGQVIKEWTAN